MFAHVRATGCGGAVALVKRVERFLVLFGYSGTGLHGSQLTGDEIRSPTAEGVLIGAVQAAMLAQHSATACLAEIHSRAARTDPGVHALSNAVYLRVTTQYEPSGGAAIGAPLGEAAWLEAVRAQLALPAAALEVLRRFDLGGEPMFDARNACQKCEFLYHVPYRSLLLPDEEAEAAADADTEGGAGDPDVWVCDLPDDCSAENLRAFVERLPGFGATFAVSAVAMAPNPGSAVITAAAVGSPHSAAAAAIKLCVVLDGALGFPNSSGPLLALPSRMATRRKAVHVRISLPACLAPPVFRNQSCFVSCRGVTESGSASGLTTERVCCLRACAGAAAAGTRPPHWNSLLPQLLRPLQRRHRPPVRPVRLPMPLRPRLRLQRPAAGSAGLRAAEHQRPQLLPAAGT